MYKYYGTDYKVFITFDENMTELEVEKFIEDNFDESRVMSKDGHKLELFWEVPENEGVHEIDIALYYILDDSKYGEYTWEYIRWYYKVGSNNICLLYFIYG